MECKEVWSSGVACFIGRFMVVVVVDLVENVSFANFNSMIVGEHTGKAELISALCFGSSNSSNPSTNTNCLVTSKQQQQKQQQPKQTAAADNVLIILVAAVSVVIVYSERGRDEGKSENKI